MNKDSLFRKELTPDDGYVHFIAVGGIGMSGLAKILLETGFKISGSDLKSNEIVRYIEDNGGLFTLGHSAENIKDCALVVVSSAIKSDNPELIEAKRQNIPVIHRAQLLEALMSGFGRDNKQYSIGITGTHGKTTTSGMTAFLFKNAGLNPSFALGGQLPGNTSNKNTKNILKEWGLMGGDDCHLNSKAGTGNYFISELDESDGSIELYTPDISIITNLELDHADFYTDGLEQIYKTFERYVYDLDKNSKIIINTDDNGNLELLKRINCEAGFKSPVEHIITYSTDSQHFLHGKAVYRAETIETAPNAKMKVFKNNELLGEITLGVPGVHNISNGLAAIAVAFECGIDFPIIAESLKEFTGMKRRFQTLGYVKGARIIDDYAHHPTEIFATLKTAKEIVNSSGKGRVIAVFQPHRYTRLENLWNDFVKSFKEAELVYICDVYSAGENPVERINSENLCGEINYTKAVYVAGDLDKIAEAVGSEITENDIVLTMGAGNITYLGEKIMNNLPSEISLTGNELGEYKDIEELRKIAREEYRKLQGQVVKRNDLGEIKFDREGWDKITHKGADARKFQLIPKLKEIIRTAEYINKTEPKTQKHIDNNVIAFHWLENNVKLGDENLRVGIQIKEDNMGNKFYSLNQDMLDWDKKYPLNRAADQERNLGDNNNITDINENFNPVVKK